MTTDEDDIEQFDFIKERESFIKRTGQTPEDWLVSWYAEQLPHNAENYSFLNLACFITHK